MLEPALEEGKKAMKYRSRWKEAKNVGTECSEDFIVLKTCISLSFLDVFFDFVFGLCLCFGACFVSAI